jgi:hypothetical protein
MLKRMLMLILLLLLKNAPPMATLHLPESCECSYQTLLSSRWRQAIAHHTTG